MVLAPAVAWFSRTRQRSGLGLHLGRRLGIGDWRLGRGSDGLAVRVPAAIAPAEFSQEQVKV